MQSPNGRARSQRRSPLALALALVAGSLMVALAVAASGCDDEASTQPFPGEDPDFFTGGPPDADAGAPDVGGGEDTALVFEDCCILIPLGGVTTQEANVGGRARLGVVLYSRESGQQVGSEAITWALSGSGDASLSALQTQTDAQGVAQVELNTGSAVTTYEVVADHPEAPEVRFEVTVTQLPSGDLQVNVFNSAAGVIEVTPFDVHVFEEGTLNCRQLNALRVPAGAVGESLADPATAPLRFDGLLSAPRYTVVGVGYGPNGNVLSEGCVDGVELPPGELTEVDLVLQLIPLNPVGTYKVRSYFNFGDAIAATGPFGEVLVTVFDGFDNPAQLLIDELIFGTVCEALVGGLICDLIKGLTDLTGVTEAIEDIINDAITSSETGCAIIRAGCNIRGAIRNLEVLSQVYLGKLGADFRIFGATNFTGLALYWNDARFPLESSALDDLQLLSGEWQGSIVGYDELIIESHAVDLNYGQLIVFVINEVVLPALTDGNANNIEDALVYWFNCQGIAQSIGARGFCVPATSLCLTEDIAFNLCEGAIGALSSLLGIGEAVLGLQNIDSAMTLSGRVKMVETSGDFLVDELVGGEWNGTINFDGDSAPVSATWSGCRPDETGDCVLPEVDSGFGAGGTCEACSE